MAPGWGSALQSVVAEGARKLCCEPGRVGEAVAGALGASWNSPQNCVRRYFRGRSLELSLGFFNFIFQLQFTFSIILYWFQVYSTVIRHSYTLQSAAPDVSSTHLTSNIVIKMLLAIFSMLCFTSP